MRSHNIGFMTMGTVESYMQYIKQNMNTENSTEDKLVVVYDVLTQVIWAQYFLKEQGYNIHDNIIY